MKAYESETVKAAYKLSCAALRSALRRAGVISSLDGYTKDELVSDYLEYVAGKVA